MKWINIECSGWIRSMSNFVLFKTYSKSIFSWPLIEAAKGFDREPWHSADDDYDDNDNNSGGGGGGGCSDEIIIQIKWIDKYCTP